MPSNTYVLVDRGGVEDDYEYASMAEAVAEASRLGGYAVVEREYEYNDSSLVWTPDGEGTWPPAE